MATNEAVRRVVEEKGMSIQLRDDGSVSKWITIGEMDSQGHSFGIDLNGHWVGETAGGLIDFHACEFFAPLLPVMDEDVSSFRVNLQRSLQDRGLPTELEASFPYSDVVKCGLGRSTYWVEKALGWLKTIGPTNEFISLLESAIKDKSRVAQKARQQAQMLLRSLQSDG